jgi:hypothetical protein
MGEKLVIGPINKGLKLDREPFVIDNDSFPTLINAYQWRGRIKRKRGTTQLTRLQRFLGSTDGSGNLTVTISPQPILSGLASFTVGTDVFTDPGGASPVTLITNSSGSATLNRSTGVLSITGSQISTSVIYFPTLPVMGLETLSLTPTQFPGELGFDTTYSYNIPTTVPHTAYDVSFYKNPAANGITLPSYVPKSTWTPLNWNGANYQQFWSTNYQGALWVTNGIDTQPTTLSTIGMQFKSVATVSGFIAGPPAAITLTTTTPHNLVVGDFVFLNEFVGLTGVNFQTGYVTNTPTNMTLGIVLPNATIGGVYSSGGIVQALTNTVIAGKDCLRWYDGDPTNGSIPPSFVQGHGWVNFMPPISQGKNTIADLPAAQYYLVGARMIVPFKDRLLFLGPVVQSSTTGPFYLQDTVIYSQNGTPYYTCSYTNTPNAGIDTPVSSTNVFNPILVPDNQTATSPAYFNDQTGFGGFVTAAISQPLLTVSANEDALIMGFSSTQTKFLYTGNDIIPFTFFAINSELGSGSTFSVINLDQGVITRGSRGYTITGQTQSQRIDLEIPDQVFEVNLLTNGNERFTAQRDFINEWIYFSYPSNQSMSGYIFNNQTLQYNYRDNSWAIFNESYTTYGSFTEQTGYTWSNIGQKYPKWSEWNVSWEGGGSTPLQPKVVAGNQQGFVFIRDQGTSEQASLSIQNLSGNTVTSPDHCLNVGDYIIITGALDNGTANLVNGKIFSVLTAAENTFILNPPINATTYQGGAVITRLYVPQIQTKQFPTSWGFGRKTRIGPQQYLLSTTENSQIQLLIFLSQDDENAYNTGPIVPSNNVLNNSLIYSTVLYTCPESTNLGLTPANINLQMPTASQQQQIWHRVNTSLIGDTVQLGFTVSDSQMRMLIASGSSGSITGASQATSCVLQIVNDFAVGQLVMISGVVGMTQLNGNTYLITAQTSTQITIQVNSTGFSSYVSGGTATQVDYLNTNAEIELHGIIMDVSPSQVLA